MGVYASSPRASVCLSLGVGRVFVGHVCYVTDEEERKRTRGPHLSCVGVWPMSDACHMTSMPHALASGLALSSLTLWGLSYILLCGGNSIDLRYTPPAFFGDSRHHRV